MEGGERSFEGKIKFTYWNALWLYKKPTFFLCFAKSLSSQSTGLCKGPIFYVLHWVTKVGFYMEDWGKHEV